MNERSAFLNMSQYPEENIPLVVAKVEYSYRDTLLLLEALPFLGRDLDRDLERDSVLRSSLKVIQRPLISCPSYFSMARFISERDANSTTLQAN